MSASIPGPCLALVVCRSLQKGFGAGLATATGIMVSKLLLLALAWALVLGLVELSAGAFETMRVGGASVFAIIVLGMLRPPRPAEVAGAALIGGLGAGFCTGLSSPLALVFMLAVLPPLVALSARYRGAFATSRWVGRAGALALLGLAGAALIQPL